MVALMAILTRAMQKVCPVPPVWPGSPWQGARQYIAYLVMFTPNKGIRCESLWTRCLNTLMPE